MTYLDQFQERDDAEHVRERQRDADAKVREWKTPAAKLRAELIQDEIDWRRKDGEENENRIKELEALLCTPTLPKK